MLVEQFTVEQNLAIPYSLSIEDLSADLKARVAALAEEIGFAPSDLGRQSGVLPPLGPAAPASRPRPGHEPEGACWPNTPTRRSLLTKRRILAQISSESSTPAAWPRWC